MRGLLALLAAASLSVAAQAADPAKPAQPSKAITQPADSSAGSSATTPEDAHVEHLRREDERRATESKRKMKQKPGYKEEVPGPRA